MKILYITPFPIEKSSSGQYTDNLAEYFMTHGHEVLVVNIDNEQQIYEKPFEVITLNFTEKNNFKFPCYTTHPNTNITYHTLTGAQINTYYSFLKTELKKIITSFSPDIIHTQYVWMLGAIIKTISNTPIVTTSFGVELNALNKDNRYNNYVQQTVNASRFIIAPSKHIEIQLRDHFHSLDSIKLKLIYRGFDDSVYQFIDENKDVYRKYFSISEECKHIICFNDNLTHIKGIDIFIQSAETILSQRNDICFVIVGNGDYAGEVIKKTKEHRNKILYFPEITEEEKPLLFHISDITVIPSRFEQFGINALESLAMGTPVIASKTGELQYFINNENGKLIENINTDLLINAINELLDINFKNKASFFCHQFAMRNYSRNSANNIIKKLYEYALSE